MSIIKLKLNPNNGLSDLVFTFIVRYLTDSTGVAGLIQNSLIFILNLVNFSSTYDKSRRLNKSTDSLFELIEESNGKKNEMVLADFLLVIV